MKDFIRVYKLDKERRNDMHQIEDIYQKENISKHEESKDLVKLIRQEHQDGNKENENNLEEEKEKSQSIINKEKKKDINHIEFHR